jgi:hypothetical protein
VPLATLKMLLRLLAKHGGKCMHQTIKERAPWMPAEQARSLVDEAASAPRPNREDIRQAMMPQAVRERHRVYNIPPIDMTDEDLAEHNRLKRNARRRLKQKRIPRSIYRANSKSQTKPWDAEGISRRSWYRCVNIAVKVTLRVRQVWSHTTC